MDLDEAWRKFRGRFVDPKFNPNDERSNHSSAENTGFTAENAWPNPQTLLAEESLAELSLAKPSHDQLAEYDWWI